MYAYKEHSYNFTITSLDYCTNVPSVSTGIWGANLNGVASFHNELMNNVRIKSNNYNAHCCHQEKHLAA